MDLAELTYQKRQEIKDICAKHGATDVRVFGSVARGDYTEKSDVDILINLESSKLEGVQYFSTLGKLEEELQNLLGCDVDVVDEIGLRDSIREFVLGEAIAL